ncbi:glycosyltransferase [Maribacter algicola]|uniref:Glycosyltransferase n=1 Tax=Meishania litoralis TaxID=3434685 RepID=A0ACC7LIN9_9FLAO
MPERKNICITINSLAPGGAEKQSLLLAKALRPYHNATVVIINPKPCYEAHVTVINNEGLDHVFLSKNPVRKFYQFQGFLKTRKIDIIFAFLPTDTIWASICGKICGVPYIFGGIRNSHIAYAKYAALRFVNNNLLDYTIANNYAAYESAIEFGFKKKVMVVPNGIEMRPMRQTVNASKTISIISVGRLVRQKDYETALKAILELKNLTEKAYSLRYRIVGSGPEQQHIETLVESFGLNNEVELITDPHNIYELLESSDIYLCTSTFEGISNSIMEAMNCSLPVVATDAGDNSRLVLHGQTGFLAKIGDFQELANFLFEMIESPKERTQMGIKGYDHLADGFSYETFQKRYLKLIENIGEIEIVDGIFR